MIKKDVQIDDLMMNIFVGESVLLEVEGSACNSCNSVHVIVEGLIVW